MKGGDGGYRGGGGRYGSGSDGYERKSLSNETIACHFRKYSMFRKYSVLRNNIMLFKNKYIACHMKGGDSGYGGGGRHYGGGGDG
ncbi:predicted protein [Arabidopsis lyrata subsp. lyrata]|uniref:Predicted protein n=1 Tax=Arabidopsis lyrata subsp. lyrata TaxID=81972 RepID=D7MNN2_ARALL|nr:predicted protein [Arabidopsis lyrata subsp. lyrata]